MPWVDTPVQQIHRGAPFGMLESMRSEYPIAACALRTVNRAKSACDAGGTQHSKAPHQERPPLQTTSERGTDPSCTLETLRAVRKCIRSTIIPNLIRSSRSRDTNPTCPSQTKYLGENEDLRGKSISRATSSSLRMLPATALASPRCTTASCLLMLSVQTDRMSGTSRPHLSRDFSFTSRNNRLSRFQPLEV